MCIRDRGLPEQMAFPKQSFSGGFLNHGADGVVVGIIAAGIKTGDRQAPVSYTHLDVYKRQVYNDGALSQLPDDVAVELPITVDGDGVHKRVVRSMPDGVIGLMNQQVSAQRLSIRAAAQGSKELALQALLCDCLLYTSRCV